MTFGTTDGADGILLLADSSALGTSAGGLSIKGNNQTGGVQLMGGITISDAISFEGRASSGTGDIISNLSGNNIVAGLMTGAANGGNYNFASQAGLIDFQGGITTATAGRLLNLRGAGNGKISGAITNTGSGTIGIRLQGSGIWELFAANSHVGTTSISGSGTLKLTNNLALQNSALDTNYVGGGTVDFTGVNTPTLGGLTSAVNLVLPSNVTSLTLNPGTGLTQTYTGSLSGGTGLALTKSGAGTQVLGNSNSYSGATTVSAGILNITTATALGSTSGVSVTGTGASGVLELANGVTVTGKSLTISGYGLGVRGALRAASGATAEWAGPVTIGGVGSPTDNRVGAMDNATLTISGKISDGTQSIFMVSADGATGKVIVSGANDYTGQTQIMRGTLALGANNSLPTGTILNVHAGSSVSDPAVFDLNNYNQQVAGLYRGATNGGVTGTATVTNSSGTTKTLTISNSSVTDYSYDSAITGNLELVKAGTAKQTLTATNSFTGGTRIDAGTLALGNATDTLADGGAVNVNGGTLDIGTNADTVGAVTLTSGSITGSGAALQGVLTGTSYDVRSGSVSAKLAGTGVALTKTTGGTVTLSGINSYTGTTSVSAGTLAVSESGTLGNGAALTMGGGTLDLGTLSQTVGAVSVTTATASGDTIKNGNLTGTSYAASNTTGNAVISANLLVNGSAGFAKSGTGSITLTGANTYTGGTTISNGTLILGHNPNDDKPAIKGDVMINGTNSSTNGYLFLQQNNQLESSAKVTLNATYSGKAYFSLGGNSQTISALSAVSVPDSPWNFVQNSYTETGLGNGSLTISGSSTEVWGSKVTVRDTGSGGSGTLALVLAGSTNLTVGTGSVSNTGGWTVQDSAKLQLSGNFGGTVPVIIKGGTLASDTSNVRSISGTVSLDGNVTLGDATNNGKLTFGGATTLTGNRQINTASDVEFTAAIGQNEAGRTLTKSGTGTLTLTGANTYTGETTIKAGTLTLGSTGTIASSKIIVGDADSSGTVLDVSSKTGGFTISSGQTLSGIGMIDANDGTDKYTVTIEGTHTPGNSPGIQTVDGNLSYASGSVFEWDLASNTMTQGAGTEGSPYTFDQVNVTGNLTIDESTTTGAVFKIVLGTAFNSADTFWTASRSWDVFYVSGTNDTLFKNFELYNTSTSTTKVDYDTFGSFSYTFASNTGTLNWTAVPEPTSALAGLLVAAGLLRRRREA